MGPVLGNRSDRTVGHRESRYPWPSSPIRNWDRPCRVRADDEQAVPSASIEEYASAGFDATNVSLASHSGQFTDNPGSRSSVATGPRVYIESSSTKALYCELSASLQFCQGFGRSARCDHGESIGLRSAPCFAFPRPSAHPCSEFVSKRLIARKPPRDRMSIRVFDFLLLKHHAASPDAAICSKHQRIGALACGQEGHRVSVFAALGAAIQAQRAFSVRLKDGHETSVVRGTPLTPRGPLSSACRMATARPAPCASAYRGTDRHSCGC